MEKFDLKDRKILYHLDLDSRQSLRSLGKKVGLSKDVVTSRVKKLQEKGIIKNFYTVIDYSKLGYSSYRIYLVFQHTTPEIEKDMINYFVKNGLVFWVCKAQGPIDLEIAIWIKDIIEFDKFWEKTLQKYGHYFSKQIFSAYLNFCNFKSSYLLGEEIIINHSTNFDFTGLSKSEFVDKTDLGILKELSNNSRLSTSEISKNLDMSSQSISNRINNLVKRKIIVGYRINIDFLKLGYKFYKVDITLTDYLKRNQLINIFKTNPYLFMLTKTAGYADLELDFIVEDVTQLLEIIDDVKKKIPDVIKSYNYFFQPEIHKISYFPDIK